MTFYTQWSVRGLEWFGTPNRPFLITRYTHISGDITTRNHFNINIAMCTINPFRDLSIWGDQNSKAEL